MRIAIFTDTFYPNIDGAVTSIINSIEILSKKGHKILIIAPNYKKNKKLMLHKNISLVRVRSTSLPNYKDFRYVLHCFKKCLAKIKSFNPDLIHIETYSTLGFTGAKIAKKLNLPLIGTYHTIAAEFVKYLSPINLLGIDKILEKMASTKKIINLPHKDSPIKKIIWKITIYLYNQCDVIVTPSVAIKKELIKRGIKKRVIFISNGIKTSLFPRKLAYSKHPRRLIHVGRISYEKRIDIILHSFKEIVHSIPDAKLTIVGSGPALNHLKRLASKLELYPNVSFLGFVPYKRLKKYYHNNDIFLTASPMETQGLVILEAMSCGLPVIGVDRYAIPDLVKHKKNGFIVKKDYIKTIAKYAIELMNSPKTLKAMSKKAVEEAKKHELKKCVEELERAYKSLIN